MAQLPNQHGGVIDPAIQKYMEQQRWQQLFAKLAQMGQGMIAAGSRGAGVGTALAQGVGQAAGGGGSRGGGGGAGDMLQMMKLQAFLKQNQERQEAQQRARGQRTSVEALTAGNRYDAQKGILWNRPPAPGRKQPDPITPAQEQDLAAKAYPEAAAAAAGAKYFPEPVPPPPGMQATPEGGLANVPGYAEALGKRAEAERAPEKRTERQTKIQELLARGVSQEQAEDIASGRVRVSTDPVTGAIRFANVTTGGVTQPAGQSDIPKKTRAEMAGQVQSIDVLLTKMPSLQKAIEKGVGFIPAAKEFGGKVLGQLPTGSVDVPGVGEIGTGEAAVDSGVVKARTQLRIFREDVIAAFRKSGRVPVQEQQRILQFVDKLGVLNSVPDAKLAFQQLEQELRRVRDTYDAQLGGQTSVPDNPYSSMSDEEILEMLKQQGHDIGG